MVLQISDFFANYTTSLWLERRKEIDSDAQLIDDFWTALSRMAGPPCVCGQLTSFESKTSGSVALTTAAPNRLRRCVRMGRWEVPVPCRQL